MLIPGNANLQDEMLQSHGESSSHPTRRLSIEDVQNALRNISSDAISVRSNASSNDPPSILKSNMVYSPAPAVDANPNSNEEATNNTAYMLRLLMMVDSFPVDDRVNLGLPATDRLPNTLSFKPDQSSQIVAATNRHVNNYMQESEVKEEEGGGEGEDCEQPLGGLLREANEGQPQTSLNTLLTYKPKRVCTPNNEEGNVSTTSEPLSSPEKALQTLEALASRAANQSSSAHPANATDTDGKSHPSAPNGEPNIVEEALESTMLKYKPKRKNSPPSNMSGLTAQEAFGSFTTMISTGSFRDTNKRCVPTVSKSNSYISQKNRNDSWKFKGKSSRIDESSKLNSTFKSSDNFPSTGTFRDSAKRHVRTVSEPNQVWDIKPSLSQPVMPSSRAAATPGPSGHSDSVSDLLNNNLLPSTGTFKDLDKRHVRLMSEPKPNEEWDLKQNHFRNFSVPDSFGYNPSTNPGSNRDIRVKSRQNQPENQKNLFQVYMENKAKLESVQQKPSASVEHVASIPPKAVEATKPAAKGELLVDWGDQGSDSEDEEHEENNGVITFIKNDSSRRISDITTQDDFDDLDEAYDTSLEMRERIRSLSIPEEPSWSFDLNPVKSNEGKNDDYFLADEDEGVGTEEVPPTDLQRGESECTSTSSETVKTSGKKCSTYDNIIVETSINNVEMGVALIRNMSAITLHESSDEELDV